MSNISESSIQTITQSLTVDDPALFERGVRQSAALWRSTDGTEADFESFCKENYLADPVARERLFNQLSTALEQFNGTANSLSVNYKKPTQLSGPEPTTIDYILGNYNPYAHFSDDMFDNKVAFICTLNFPNYTLEEKNNLGKDWSRLQWAYSRLGDIFTSRVPASVSQQMAQAEGNAENYIASYNIMMGHILFADAQKYFPGDMVLLSHWNLRDELKSNYAPVPHGLEKQRMIYKIMEHIACQTIPEVVINNPDYDWDPVTGKVYQNGKEIEAAAEGDKRYARILEVFHAQQALDAYEPAMPTGIIRNFEGSMEVSAKEIEDLFVSLVSSPAVSAVAKRIQERLGRPLEPFDIWYDGFKGRTSMPEDELTARTRTKYPTPEAFHQGMPAMLENLGFTKEKAEELASRIVVEGARGSGHAWGASSRVEPARLRTRIGSDGMDYKGYNIAVHEFGHNVEQTLSLYDMDYYTLNGVPNTAFTETLAFIFQKRDLELLGYPWAGVDNNTTLDIFWGCYEIMGVALVDMYTWQWLYNNPQATATELRDAVLSIARDVWNRYYEPILGTHDSPILAIYSHMVNSPMYLPNYPFGHIIEYQLEAHLASYNKEEFAQEIIRLYTLGRLTPNCWMQQAVGSDVSSKPLIDAVMSL